MKTWPRIYTDERGSLVLAEYLRVPFVGAFMMSWHRIEVIQVLLSIESSLMLVLASASPRRKEVLQNAGIPFTVDAADIPEIPMDGEPPIAYAERLAREKALAVLEKHSGNFVLGADTIVVVDATILGKPRDSSDAVRMLRLLSARQHEVITGVCLVGGKKPDLSSQFPVPSFVDVRSETTRVFVGNIEEREIRDYVSTGEPMDKAGAYAIQGRASRWISRIEGDYFNVVGLPVAAVWGLLKTKTQREDAETQNS